MPRGWAYGSWRLLPAAFGSPPKTRELLHLAPDEALVYETFLKAIHPEDRERVDQVVQQALQSDGKFEIDYRIVLPDESTRWIAASGQRFLKLTGELDRLMGVSIDISERKRMEGELNKRLKEIEELKQRLENENLYLRKELREQKGFDKIVGDSKAIRSVLYAANQVASTDATVPGGPFLPAQCFPHINSAPQAANRRYPAAGPLLHGKICRQDGQTDRECPQSHDKDVPGV